jgi:hypothetical protein
MPNRPIDPDETARRARADLAALHYDNTEMRDAFEAEIARQTALNDGTPDRTTRIIRRALGLLAWGLILGLVLYVVFGIAAVYW